MKKAITSVIMIMFVLSLLPFAAAEEISIRASNAASVSAETDDSEDSADTSVTSSTDSNIEARKEAREEAKAKAQEEREAYKKRIESLRESQKAKIKALSEEKQAKFANLSGERLQKIAELDARLIERLSELNIKNVEKIAELKKERLEKLAELREDKLERLSELEKEKLEKISNLDRSDIEKLSLLSRARLGEMANMDLAGINAGLKAISIIKVKNANELNKRNLTESELAQLRAKFDNAKEKFKEAKDKLNEERKALNEARKEKNENDLIGHSKAYLVKFSDALTSHLEKLKAKVQENNNIDEETEAKIVAEIDAQIAGIAEIKAEAQAATTKEQVKAAAEKLRKKWNELKNFIDLNAKRVVAARVEGIVNHGLVLEKRLDNVLAKAKEKGIEINVTAEISTFSQHIADSRENYLAAQAKISAAFDLRAKGEPADSDNIKSLLKEADQLLDESRDSLRSAHETLKEILKNVKAAMPDADLSSDVEVEVEQESD